MPKGMITLVTVVGTDVMVVPDTGSQMAYRLTLPLPMMKVPVPEPGYVVPEPSEAVFHPQKTAVAFVSPPELSTVTVTPEA